MEIKMNKNITQNENTQNDVIKNENTQNGNERLGRIHYQNG